MEQPDFGPLNALMRGHHIIGLRRGENQVEGHDEFLLLQGFPDQPLAAERDAEPLLRRYRGQFGTIETVA